MVWLFSLTRTIIREAYAKIGNGDSESDVVSKIMAKTCSCCPCILRWRVSSAVSQAFKAHKLKKIDLKQTWTIPGEIKPSAEKVMGIFSRTLVEKQNSDDPYILSENWNTLVKEVDKQAKKIESDFHETREYVAKEYGISINDVDCIISTFFQGTTDLFEKRRQINQIFHSPQTLLYYVLGVPPEKTTQILLEEKQKLKAFKSNEKSKIAKSLILHRQELGFKQILAIFRQWSFAENGIKRLTPPAIQLANLKTDPQFQQFNAFSKEQQLKFLKKYYPILHHFLFQTNGQDDPGKIAYFEELRNAKDFLGCIEFFCPFSYQCHQMEGQKEAIRNMSQNNRREAFKDFDRVTGHNFNHYIERWLSEPNLSLRSLEIDPDFRNLQKMSSEYTWTKQVAGATHSDPTQQNPRTQWCQQKVPEFYQHLRNLQIEVVQGQFVPVNLTDEEIEKILIKSEELANAQGADFDKFQQGVYYLINNFFSFLQECKGYVVVFGQNRGISDQEIDRINAYGQTFNEDQSVLDENLDKSREFLQFYTRVNSGLSNLNTTLIPFKSCLLTEKQGTFVSQYDPLVESPNQLKAKAFYKKRFEMLLSKPYPLGKTLQDALDEYIGRPKEQLGQYQVTQQFQKDANRTKDPGIDFINQGVEEHLVEPIGRLAKLQNIANSIPHENERETLFFLLQELNTQTAMNFGSEIFFHSLKADRIDTTLMSPVPTPVKVTYEKINNGHIRVVYRFKIDRLDVHKGKRDPFFATTAIEVKRQENGTWIAENPVWKQFLLPEAPPPVAPNEAENVALALNDDDVEDALVNADEENLGNKIGSPGQNDGVNQLQIVQ